MIREWLTRLALRTPIITKLRDRADAAIAETRAIEAETQRSVGLMGEELRYQRMRLSERMADMMDLRIAEIACHDEARAREVAEAWASSPSSGPVQLRERAWELELGLEDRGWQREQAMAALEFSRYGVGLLRRQCRIMALKSPLVKRGAEIVAMYVFGRGIEIGSEDDKADVVIKDFLARASAELGHIGLAAKEESIQTDGALYFGLPTAKQVDLQMIEPDEIMDLITDPDDSSKDWYYRRQWTRQVIAADGRVRPERMEAFYPSMQVAMEPPANFVKLDRIQGHPVNWAMPIYRVKIGCPPKWRWEVPPLYASLDWALAYKDFLEDWATVQRTLARFALMVQTSGGPGAIAAYQALLSTNFADNSGTQIERNPPPNVGSAHIGGPDTTIKAFHGAGSHTGPEQARRLLLMFCCGVGLPETFTGDASTGSLATALSLDRPTELKFKEIQQRWQMTVEDLLAYVLWVEDRTPNTAMREARIANPQSDKAKPRVVFPAVLEHDITAMVKAWVDIVTLGGHQGVACGMIDRRTALKGMLQEVGYQDVDELIDVIFGKDYNPAADVEEQKTQVAAQNITATDPSVSDTGTARASKPKAKGSLAEAVAHVRELVANGHS